MVSDASHPRSRSGIAGSSSWNKVTLKRWLVLAGVSLAGDGWTYEASVMGSILQLPAFVAHLGYADEGIIPDSINSWLGPVYTLGQLFGGLIAAFICDWFGRKMTLWTGSIVVLTSTSLLMASNSVATVIIGRVLQGVSIGFLLLGYQVYAVELASRRDRGFVSTFSLVSGNITGLVAACVLYGITYAEGDWAWRLCLGISYIPAFMLFCVLPFVPESPRWLYLKGRDVEARHVFGRMHGFADGSTSKVDDKFALSEPAQEEYDAMVVAIDSDKARGLDKWKAFVNTGSARYRLYVSLSSQFWWAWNGSSVLTYYYSQVFTGAGITDTHLIFGVNSILNAAWIVGAFVGGWALDVIGRRACYAFGLAQMGVFLFIEGAISVALIDQPTALDPDYLPPTSVGAAWVSCYLIHTFFSSAVNLLPAELWPSGLRARGFALSNVVSMSIGFATQYSALRMYRSLEGSVWFVFGSVMIFGAIVVFLTYPEPKGLVLEEVEILFGTESGDQIAQVTGLPLSSNYAPIQRLIARRRPQTMTAKVINHELDIDQPKHTDSTESSPMHELPLKD